MGRKVPATEPYSTIEAFGILDKDISEHKERGVVLAYTSSVERALRQLLKEKFASMSDASGREINFFLEGQVPPLGSASVQARMARILGMIDAPLCEACRKLFDLRNEYAHNGTPPALGEGELDAIWQKLPQVYRDGLARSCDIKTLPADRLFAQIIAIILCLLEGARNVSLSGGLSDHSTHSEPPETS